MRTRALISLAAALGAGPALAKPPLFVTTVTAGKPDPNGKVPTFNAVPGAGVANYDVASPVANLIQGTIYTYCVSIETLGFSGAGSFAYALTRGGATVQAATIGSVPNLQKNGIYALCVNGAALPDSPGAVDLTGSVSVTYKGKPVTAKLTTKVMISK